MERRGLVCREECASDARGSMVRLTAAGRKAIDAASPDHVDAVRSYFFDHLTADEQTQLAGLLSRIATNIPGDVCATPDCDE
jgi:DNA-binding MarR family transcriptional regulator